MTKPRPRSRKALDYNEMITYLEHKYSFNNRDFLGRYGKEIFDGEVPYCDFWHWMLKNAFYDDISNGCYRTIYIDELLESHHPGWVNKILTYIKREFASKKDSIEVFIAW